MALIVSEDSLVKPQGRLDWKVLWPRKTESTVYDWLAGWIAQAKVKAVLVPDEVATKAEMVREWAYSLAYDDVHERLLVNPSSQDLAGQGSQSWAQVQIQKVADLAQAARDRFTELYEEALTTVQTGPTDRASYCAPTVFSP